MMTATGRRGCSGPGSFHPPARIEPPADRPVEPVGEPLALAGEVVIPLGAGAMRAAVLIDHHVVDLARSRAVAGVEPLPVAEAREGNRGLLQAHLAARLPPLKRLPL